VCSSDLAKLGKLEAKVKIDRGGRFNAEIVDDIKELDENTILAFTINFEPNQTDFSAEVYGPEFLRAIEAAATFGNTIIAVRGHSDPTKSLIDLIRAGMTKGILKRSGSSGHYKYYLNGKTLDLTQTDLLMKMIEKGDFDGTKYKPRETMQAALNLSRARAAAVQKQIIAYAKKAGLNIDETQIQPMGVGVREPLIAKPINLKEAKVNMRVEFRVLKVPAEAVKPSDFDF